jgi:catechol 2,3-dioxygenase-like lactoylglutathione lyase family enzyme
MSGAPTIAELVVGASPDHWRAAGFAVGGDDRVAIGTVTIRLDADGDRGISSWLLRAPMPSEIDGLATTASPHSDFPDSVVHPNHVVAIDHLVVLTPDLDRTIDALAEQGLELRRIREGPAGDGREVKQAFFRMAEVILEVVATGRGGDEPAQFWGLTFLSDDLDATLTALGPERVTEARPAVQPGRRIATVRESAGLGVPVALMDR